MVPRSVLIVAVYVLAVSIVIGGALNCGLGSGVEGLDGQPAALDAASAVACAADGGAVVVVVVVAAAVVEWLHGLVIRRDRPTTTTTAMPMVTARRMPRLRLTAFCSASRRA